MIRKVRESPEGMRLAGSRCGECTHPTVPSRAVCPNCRSASVKDALFGPLGKTENTTELMVPTEGVEAPYWVAHVRLEDGPVIFARVVGEVRPGDPVELRTEKSTDRYWFSVITPHQPATRSQPTT